MIMVTSSPVNLKSKKNGAFLFNVSPVKAVKNSTKHIKKIQENTSAVGSGLTAAAGISEVV